MTDLPDNAAIMTEYIKQYGWDTETAVEVAERGADGYKAFCDEVRAFLRRNNTTDMQEAITIIVEDK